MNAVVLIGKYLESKDKIASVIKGRGLFSPPPTHVYFKDALSFVKESLLNKDKPLRRVTTFNKQQVIVFQGHPIYYSLDGKNVSTIERNEVIAELIRRNIVIAYTIVNRISIHFPPYRRSPNFGVILQADGIGKLSPCSISADAHTNSIIAIDGIPGAGKTSLLKKMKAHCINEPVNMIYEIIRSCKARGIDRFIQQTLVEEAVNRYELNQIDSLRDSGKELVYIERNWLYSEWIFGVRDSVFPICDTEMVEHITKAGYRLNGVIYLSIEPEKAHKRLIKRGNLDDISLEWERILSDRLSILYESRYEWAFSHVIEKR